MRRSSAGIAGLGLSSFAMLVAIVGLAQTKQPAPLPPPAGEPKIYEVHRATGPIDVDGKPDEKAWKQAVSDQ